MARPEVVKTELAQRIRDIRLRVGDLSRDEFAQEIGLSPKTVANYERGDTQPDAEAVAAIRKRFGINANWLVTGDGAMRDTDGPVGGIDIVALPFFSSVSASAGPGLAVGVDAPDAVIGFARSFLRDQGATPEKCSVIRAKGDSMAPTIPDASLLVVDHSQAEVANGCIMVINIGEDLLVKRIRRRIDGLVDLVSDNPAYPPETIGRDTIQQLRIVGRVVYFCRVP